MDAPATPTSLGPAITTLALRKAAEAVVQSLSAYAVREGGCFVIYGSAVAGTLRYDSDLDVLVDFPPDTAAAAWRFVEEVCALHGIPPDLHDAGTSRPAFVERVRARGLALGLALGLARP